MKLNRSITNKVNWLLDNLVPPIVRDSKLFMSLWFYLLFGGKFRLFMGFKEKAPFLSQEEYEYYYKILSDKHIQRDTDLSPGCLERILSSVVGESVVDIGCGRGYLVRKIAAQNGIPVVGVDISIPDIQDKSDNILFVRHNIEDLPFEDYSFDTVICTHTIEHLLDPLKTISEMRRVARKKIIIVVPRQREYKFTFDLHIHFFPYIFSLKRIMQRSDATYMIIGNDLYYEENVKMKSLSS